MQIEYLYKNDEYLFKTNLTAMKSLNIPEITRKYNFKEEDIICLLTFLAGAPKAFAWSNTVGKDSKSPNKSTLANQWFSNPRQQQFIYDYQIKDKEEKDSKEVKKIDSDLIKEAQSIEATKKEVEQTFGIIEDVTSENIKQLFINELNCSKDPEKRAALLLKLSDTLELITPEETDLLTPVIYLPERCSTCKFKQATKE